MYRNWEKTKISLKELEEKLKCFICNNILNKPWSINNCDHSFCQDCITKAINKNSKCPQCESFAWLKDLKINRELSSAVEFCVDLKKIIHCQSQIAKSHKTKEKEPTCNKAEGEQEDFESWPLSGVTKTKKLVRTYERKEKQEKTVQKHADGVYFDKSSTKDEEDRTQKVEDEFFRDEDFKNSELDGNDDSKENGCKKSKKRLKKNCNESEGTKFPPRTSKRKLAKEKEDVKHTAKKGVFAPSKCVKSEKDKKPLSVTKVNQRGETLLHVAAIKGKYDQVRELLQDNADPNAKDFAGWTPLHEACNHGCLDIVQLLLDNGAFIDIPGCDHDTPLHDAIANNRLEVAEFLISRGASLDARNKQGLLPMDYIKSNAAREQLLLAAAMATENEGAKASNISIQALVGKNRPNCILHTGLSQKQKKMLERCSRILHTEVVDQFKDEVTHVVTVADDNKICNRTMKFLFGVLTGKWMVSFEWVQKSLSSNEWINEEPFEVKGCHRDQQNVPEKARLNALKKFPPLFDGCSFYFSGEFRSNPSKSDLLDLVKYGGGVLLHREPKAETSHPLITPSSPALLKMSSNVLDKVTVAYHAKPDAAQSYCTQFVIFDAEASPNHRRISTPVMCTAPSTWILDCISKFELVET